MPKIYKLEDLQAVAKSRQGKCISKKYLGAREKHRWECVEGHVWEATPSPIINKGVWCPECAKEIRRQKKKKYSIEDMKKIALERGGKCLSKKMLNTQEKLFWICSKGHKWKTSSSSILRGSWCKKCFYEGVAGQYHKKDIEDAHLLAKEMKGVCLSKEYINSKGLLHWKCQMGHTWEASYGAISSGRWCPACANLKKSKKQIKYTIRDMNDLASNRGGCCVSKRYINSRTKLSWMCSNGHTWEATPANIKTGYWCPYCNDLIGETLCRVILEKIFKKNFIKTKPTWLVNSRSNRMELDGFCEELGLAFEHHGRQHYIKSYYAKTDRELELRKKEDKLKEKICKKNNVILLIIPEVGHLIEIDSLYDYIVNALKAFDVKIPKHDNFKYSKLDVYKNAQIMEAQGVAVERGGKFISTIYMGSSRKHEWECGEGHRWEATPSKIKMGRWCPKCAGKAPIKIEEIKEVARLKGGECLSNSIVNIKSKLIWRCGKGHEWKASASPIIYKDTWCPVCSRERQAERQRGSIKEMKKIAKAHGGKCLSKEYVTARVKLSWQCKVGHTWSATPSGIKQGKWCPKCRGLGFSQKEMLGQMQELAKKYSGKCLSKKYVNNITPLKWTCESGHVWKANPKNIKKGSWCPTCAKNKAIKRS